MAYKINPGITENELADWLTRAAAKFGTFKDGRVDYTEADIAPIVMCTLICGNVSLTTKPRIVLDHEHTDYTWTLRNKVEIYEILDDLPYAIDAALAA